MESLRKTTSGAPSANMTNSREGSRNVSREQSRNASRDSSINDRSISTTTKSTTVENPSEVLLDEAKIQTRVHALIEEYTENYSDNNNRPVNVINYKKKLKKYFILFFFRKQLKI